MYSTRRAHSKAAPCPRSPSREGHTTCSQQEQCGNESAQCMGHGRTRSGRGGIVCGPPLDGENEQRDDLDARGFRSALSGSKTARAFACTPSMSSAPTWHCGSDGDGERPARGGLRSYTCQPMSLIMRESLIAKAHSSTMSSTDETNSWQF